MATLTAARAASTFPVFSPPHGSGMVCAAWGKYTFAVNPTAADVVRMCKVPAGATVIGGYLMAADLDTGTEALDMDFGWEATADEIADPDGFGNFGVWDGDVVSMIIPVAGSWKPLQGVLLTAGPKNFTAEAMLSLTVNAPANATGTGVITAVVFYLVP